MNEIEYMLNDCFVRNNPASINDTQLLSSSLKLTLPEDYINFLLWSNGGICNFKSIRFFAWSANEVITLNELYSIRNRLNNTFVGIGTDGGDYCFALKFDSKDVGFVCIPLGALDIEEVVVLADNFKNGIKKMLNGEITGDSL